MNIEAGWARTGNNCYYWRTMEKMQKVDQIVKNKKKCLLLKRLPWMLVFALNNQIVPGVIRFMWVVDYSIKCQNLLFNSQYFHLVQVFLVFN